MMHPTSLTHTGTIRSNTASDQLTAEAWLGVIESTTDWLPSRSRLNVDSVNGESSLQAWPQLEVRFVKGACQLGVFSWREEEGGTIDVSYFQGYRADAVRRANQIADAMRAQFVEEHDDPSL